MLASSSGGHAMPPNLPQASTEGNCQSKCNKQMPLYEPAENPRTKTSVQISSFACTNEEIQQKGERGSPAEMRESSVRRSNVRLLEHLYRHQSPSVGFHQSGSWQSLFQKLIPPSCTVNSKAMESEELMHGFGET